MKFEKRPRTRKPGMEQGRAGTGKVIHRGYAGSESGRDKERKAEVGKGTAGCREIYIYREGA